MTAENVRPWHTAIGQPTQALWTTLCTPLRIRPASSRWMSNPRSVRVLSRLPILSLVVFVTNRQATLARRSRCRAWMAPGMAWPSTCRVPLRSIRAARNLIPSDPRLHA